MEVCTVDRQLLEAALAFNINDFEDAVQLAGAVSNNLEAIVTRNMAGFAEDNISIVTAGELLENLS